MFWAGIRTFGLWFQILGNAGVSCEHNHLFPRWNVDYHQSHQRNISRRLVLPSFVVLCCLCYQVQFRVTAYRRNENVKGQIYIYIMKERRNGVKERKKAKILE